MKIKQLFILIMFFHTSILAERVLIFGRYGWIGSKIADILTAGGHDVICANSRLENRGQIIDEIDKCQPNYIINAAGIIGNPNVDWCEDNKEATIRTNVLGTINLVDIAFLKGMHLTNITTGCIYEYDSDHFIGSGVGFTEEEVPNFDGSFYSRTKIQMEKLILEYPNVLNLRIKMPISLELDRGFVGKIIRYKKLINVPNSVTILEDLLPIAVDMTLKRIKGNFNLVNPGTVSHNQVMDLYKKYIDPICEWENFTIEEQNKILKARRANAELSAAKLLKLYPTIPRAIDSLKKLMKMITKEN